jgi:hypothetical protein
LGERAVGTEEQRNVQYPMSNYSVENHFFLGSWILDISLFFC